MDITITYNKENSNVWEHCFKWNELFVQSTLRYLEDLYKAEGYVYLNEIYEKLGVKWNPNNNNVCWTKEQDGQIKFSYIVENMPKEQIIISIKKEINTK